MKILLKSLLFLLAYSSVCHAVTNTWVGATSSDWFNTNNWSQLAVPAAGDDVVITNTGSNVLLTNATPYLSSLTLSNKTLTVSNGITQILATNVFIQNAGTITVASVYTTNGVSSACQMSNQVYIGCGNLTLAAGGMIYSDGLGFGGGTNGSVAGTYAPGPGGGRNGNHRGAGGGHGGNGGSGDSGASTYVTVGGITNDSAVAPLFPGSGGGWAGNASFTAGAGGGLVTIFASNSVMVNGTVTANGLGPSPSQYCGGGAGGGIYINCAIFGGSSTGLLSAFGGSTANGGGGGGGGRIAVWAGLSEAQKAQVRAGNLLRVTVAATNNYFTGTLSATNGTGYFNLPSTNAAYPGTIVFLTAPTVHGMIIKIF